ncbi:MAG TPA: hypothetical protein VF240_08935, partial [Pyrinomonadaceae bacterium]
MAEERNLATARAPEDVTADPDATKEELQRRMDEARESITQTVTEIKESVVSQYQQVRENISDTLDWREQYRRHTLPVTLGAAGAGLLLGYTIGGALFGRGDDDYDEDEYEQDDAQLLLPAATHAYASQPILGGSPSARSARRSSMSTAAAAAPAFAAADVGPDTRPGYASADAPQELASPQPSEPEGPSLFSRFRETK